MRILSQFYIFKNMCSKQRLSISFSIGGMVACLSFPVFAENGVSESNFPWSVSGSVGYTVYKEMYRDDGKTVVGRFAIGRNIYAARPFSWGIEVGVQNGNTMRYFPSQAAIDALGGLPIQTTVKPVIDLLATLKTVSLGATPLFAQLKGGIAYRRWQFNDRNSINDEAKIAGEIQAGLGYLISERASLSLSYQGLFGDHPHFRFNVDNATGRVSNIPTQTGVLLGMTVNV